MAAIALIRAYWKPLAVFLLLMLLTTCCYQKGAEHTDAKWQAKWEIHQKKDVIAALAAEKKARKQEQDWSAAFDLTANMYQESYSELEKKRDRIMRDVASGRLRVPSACPRLPEAAADSGQPQDAASGGQPGLAGEELVARLAVCDEVTLERNQAVKLLEAERRELSRNP